MMSTDSVFSELVSPLLEWYAANARILPWRENTDPYRVWLSEIMLQQTRVEAVKPYFERFLSEVPDIEALARLPEARLMKLWEGLGYYRRAAMLKRAAERIVAEHHGIFPSDYPSIRALPGIGDYTAGAIASIAFGLPAPAVDGNVLRVIARLTGCRDDLSKPKEKTRIAGLLACVYPPGRAGDFTQSLMELGATVCLPNGAPRCEVCPLSALCAARRDGTAAEIPVRPPKKIRRIEPRTVFILRYGDRIALKRRPGTGLLAGLWELPGTDGTLTPAEAEACLRGLGVECRSIAGAGKSRHIFTHLEWHMTGFAAQCAAPAPGFDWVDCAEMARSYPLPSAFAPFLISICTQSGADTAE